MKQLQYQAYRLSKREWLLVFLKGSVLIVILAYLFFDSYYAMPLLTPLFVVLIKKERATRKKQRLSKLSQEFRDGILAVSAALAAGYSVENAFKEALRDLQFLYPSQGYMTQELQGMANGMEMNQNIEVLLYEFANRCGLEDVEMFADVFSVCKRTGGDMGTVIGDCASRISEKTEIYRDIETYLSAKKLEQKIMNGMPLFILLYVRMTSPEFLEGLYGNMVGIFVMGCCLLVYGAAYLLADKLMEIEV